MRGLEARSELLRQAAVEVGCCRKKLVARENRCAQCDFGGLKLRHVERDIPGPVRPSISAGKERKVSRKKDRKMRAEFITIQIQLDSEPLILTKAHFHQW